MSLAVRVSIALAALGDTPALIAERLAGAGLTAGRYGGRIGLIVRYLRTAVPDAMVGATTTRAVFIRTGPRCHARVALPPGVRAFVTRESADV